MVKEIDHYYEKLWLDFDFTISSYCNAACPSCKRYEDFLITEYNPNQPLHPGLKQLHMDFDIYRSIIERDIELFKNKYVTFEGELGDALTNPNILKFIDYSSSVFKRLRIVTNGGLRTSKFFNDLGNTYNNLEIMFSIDGLDNEINQKYRRRVNTPKAYENMIAYKQSKYGAGATFWQYLIFQHNWFEIPEILNIAKKYKIVIDMKINNRPKFRIEEKLIPNVMETYEQNKFECSSLQQIKSR